jgi:hypothetical protein
MSQPESGRWSRRRGFLRLALPCLVIVAAASPAAASEAPASEAPAGAASTAALATVVPHVFSGDVRNLPQVAAPMRYHSWEPKEPPSAKPLAPARTTAAPANLALAPMPATTQNFSGLSFSTSVTGGQVGAGWPPDVNGDVGPNHYIEAVNDAYGIYSKTGTLLAGFTENSLWSGAGSTPCNGEGEGDPIVLHDGLADRWILTHFAFAFDVSGNPIPPFYQCIAVSRSSDPVAGGWYLYAIHMDTGAANQPPVGTLNDYPKFGLWTDCLYMSANAFSLPSGNFAGTMFASFSRSDMYAGSPLTGGLGFIGNTVDPVSMIPSNLLGTGAGSLPPAGRPNYYVSESNTAFAFEVRKFTPGANCGGGGSLSTATSIGQASYSIPGPFSVPQPNTSAGLDSLGDRLMQRVVYRRIGGSESLWLVHSTQDPGTGVVQPQWAQLDVTGGAIATSAVQQQTYVPDSTLHRWMGSLAVDGQGNMALGYSTSNGTSPNFPSVAYSGRLAGDPLNNLPRTEVQLVAGLGSQSFINRWGDYTAMTIDPADDCTFWYINEYYSSQANADAGNWQTRIASFKFPSCGQAAATPPQVVTNAATFVGPAGATLNATVNPNGGSTTLFYDYGPTTSYGSTFTYGIALTGSTALAVPHGINGLSCNTGYHFQARATNSAGSTLGGDQSFTTGACVGGSSFYTVPPCRVLDTRQSGVPLAGSSTYEVALAGFCGVPATARSVSVNVTAVGATAPGFMAFWPAQGPNPGTTTINYTSGVVRANNAVLSLAQGYYGSPGAVYVEPAGTGTVHLVIDVSGYFQ